MDNIEIDINFSFKDNQSKGHCFKYHREITRHIHRANFIFNFINEFMEFLPNQLVHTETVNGFKVGLDC